MKDSPCNICKAIDFYSKGEFSYCRPCHAESQKKYVARKAIGEEISLLRPPPVQLGDMSKSKPLKFKCAQGHILAGNNVRISSQRNGKDLKRRCKTCERNAKRVKYGLPLDQPDVRLVDLLDND